MRIIRRSAIAVAAATVLLQACGGGGGGGGSGPGGSPYLSGNPYLRTEVPYSTPTKVATVDPLVAVTGAAAVFDTFAANITGSSTGQDVIIAGRETQPATPSTWSNSKISMLSWSNGTLVDRTAQWFPADTNIILGSDPTIKFADFFRSGRTDMFVAPSTDMEYYGPAYLYQNTGTSFNRITIPLANVWGHDTAIADLNGDGYTDFIISDYGPNTTLGFNQKGVNGTNTFKTYVAANRYGDLRWGGSGIAAGNFLNNGQTQLVVTDTGGGSYTQSTRMYSWTIDPSNDQLAFNQISILPAPRTGIDHNIRAVAYDFDSSGNLSLLIIGTNTTMKYSDIQFLKNNGAGVFTDVTDTTLVGYNRNTYASYNPRFVDVNNDGLTDIIVSAQDFTGSNNSTQILMRSRDNKYVAAYQNILTDFATQSNQIQGVGTNDANTVNVVKGPGGKLYLVTATSFMNGADRNLAVYLSDLGSTSAITAQNAVDLIKAKWPYMTDVQANTALAKTAATYMTDAGAGLIIDPEAMMQPIGSLSMATARGLKPIQGFISGVDIGDGGAVAIDSLGRGYNLNIKGMNANNLPNAFTMNTEHIDQYNLTSHAEYLISGSVNTFNGLRIGSENRFTMGGSSSEGFNIGPEPKQYTIGMPEYYRNGNFSIGSQFTSLNNNPWLMINGAWGKVTNSSVLDNVVTYRNKGFSAQAGLMHVTTTITPGLITNVSNIVGGWSETGYRYTNDKFGDIGVYAGVKPVVLSGSVTANIPTSIDNNGNTVYTKKNLALQNNVTSYGRVLYTNMIDKQTMYRFSAMATQQGQYRLMHEVRFFFD